MATQKNLFLVNVEVANSNQLKMQKHLDLCSEQYKWVAVVVVSSKHLKFPLSVEDILNFHQVQQPRKYSHLQVSLSLLRHGQTIQFFNLARQSWKS